MAVKHRDGSVSLTLTDGSTVRLSSMDLASAQAATPEPAAVSPISVVTGKGRTYGTPESPRFGIFFDSDEGSFYWLNENMQYIENSSWRTRNLNKCKFTFTKPN